MTKSNEAKCFDRTIGGIHQTWMTWQSCMITSNNAQCIVHLPISNLLFRLFYLVDDPNFNATSNKMRKHSNEFNLTRTVWCPTHTKQHPKWLLNILVSVIRIENEKEKKQQRIESNALFFSLVIFVSFEIVCASSSDTSQIIAAFGFMIDFTFWHLCNNTIEPMHVSRHNRYIIQYPMQSVNGRWLSRKINFDFHWKMWIPRIVFIFFNQIIDDLY